MRASETSFESYKSKPILFFAYLICSSVFETKTLKKTSLRFAIFNFSEKLQNIFEIKLKKYGVTIEKSFSEKKYLEIKNLQTPFCCLYVKLDNYCPNLRETNKFPLTYSFQKGLKRWFGRSHLEVVKSSTVHFISKLLV